MNVPTMRIHDAVRDCQPEPGSRGPRGEEGVEQAFLIRFRDATTTILHPEDRA